MSHINIVKVNIASHLDCEIYTIKGVWSIGEEMVSTFQFK